MLVWNMSIEGAFFEAFGSAFSGDHMPDFSGQNAAIDGAAEAVGKLIEHQFTSSEAMTAWIAALTAAGIAVVVVSAKFIGGVWKVVVRIG